MKSSVDLWFAQNATWRLLQRLPELRSAASKGMRTRPPRRVTSSGSRVRCASPFPGERLVAIPEEGVSSARAFPEVLGARGTSNSGPATASCWRWSDASVEDAQQKADQRAQELAALFARGEHLNRYSLRRPSLREEIVQTLDAERGGHAKPLRRARAQCRSRDVHRCRLRRSGHEGAAIQKVQKWTAEHPELAVRVYRTHSGLRLFVTNQTYDPKAPETIALLDEVGSDRCTCSCARRSRRSVRA